MKTALAFLVVVAGCTSSSEEVPTTTFVNKEQHYRVELPQGWEANDAHGLSQFSSPKLGKHAIVVRVADRPASLGEGKPNNNDAIVDVTERVLKDLPKAKLSSRAVINGSDTPGVLFELTFAPHSARGRYHRAHALLLGKSRLCCAPSMCLFVT
jgi:hypothetical protein